MKEIFKQIRNCEGYEVSNFGKVRNSTTLKILSHDINKYNKRHRVTLGSYGRFTVARLVLDAFGENSNPKLYNYAICLDGNQNNLHIDNLAWGTSSISTLRKQKRYPELLENFIAKSNHGGTTNRKMTKMKIKNIEIYRKQGLSCKQIAEKMNVHPKTIRYYLSQINPKSK